MSGLAQNSGSSGLLRKVFSAIGAKSGNANTPEDEELQQAHRNKLAKKKGRRKSKVLRSDERLGPSYEDKGRRVR